MYTITPYLQHSEPRRSSTRQRSRWRTTAWGVASRTCHMTARSSSSLAGEQQLESNWPLRFFLFFFHERGREQQLESTCQFFSPSVFPLALRSPAFFCFLKNLSGVRMLTTFYLAKNDHRWVIFISLKATFASVASRDAARDFI